MDKQVGDKQMIVQNGLEHIVGTWDGKTTVLLEEAYGGYGREAWFVETIVGWHGERPLQRGASWLLKKHLETGGAIEPEQIQAIFRLLPELEHWETKLHILQSMGYLPIDAADVERVEAFLRGCVAADKKFVRAWAYHGFWELARQYPAYRPEVGRMLGQALEDEAASVKARVRKLVKQGF